MLFLGLFHTGQNVGRRIFSCNRFLSRLGELFHASRHIFRSAPELSFLQRGQGAGVGTGLDVVGRRGEHVCICAHGPADDRLITQSPPLVPFLGVSRDADKQRHQQRYHSNHLFPLIDTALHATVGSTTRRSVRGGMLGIVPASLGGRHYGAHGLNQAFVFFM